MFTSVGLDLSLTQTGVSVIKDGKKVYSGVIRSKPAGKKPSDELNRILNIVEDIEVAIGEYAPDGVNIVVIENLAFGTQNSTSLTQLAALNYFVREVCTRHEWPFLLVAPSTLKKFVTGKGNSDKNVMLLEIYKKWNETFTNDNEADAYALARVGELFAPAQKKKKIPETQKSVVELIGTQL